MEKIFITFGGPTTNFHEAVERLCHQAKSFGVFDKIVGYTEKDLQNFSEFWSKYEDFIQNNPRGYGYWLWKPFLILENLQKMSDGDILFYADSGCELNIKGKEKLQQLLDSKQDFKVLANKGKSNNRGYTKMDAIKFFDIDPSSKVLEDGQMEGGFLIIKKSSDTVELFREFYGICANNYHLIDDSSSLTSNRPDFVEHRHDQSIFSLLMIKKGWVNYDLKDFVFNNNSFCGNGQKPLFLIRNRSGRELVTEYIKHYPDWVVAFLGKMGRWTKKYLPIVYSWLKPLFPNQNSIHNSNYFNGDIFLAKKFLEIINREKIVNVVETGTYLGDTTKFFGENACSVYTVERDGEYFRSSQARNDLGQNIKFYLGNSWEVLDNEIIPQIKGQTVFYLDAHWGQPCPTVLELGIIAKHGLKPVIVIHDFKVPNQPGLGWDSYPDFEYKIENIEPYLEKIYGREAYRYEYNSESSGAKRGVIFIYPINK